MKKIAVIFGTRPDTIKMAPIIQEIKKNSKQFELLTIATAQHRQMLDQVLQVFDIKPDYDLNIMKPKQTLASITKNTIEELDNVFSKEKPDMVLVQGDTTTTFVGSLASFYRQIPVGHIEAGLRTNDKANPFPEEINRRLTSSITELHFAPTETAKKALLKENIDRKTVFVTGNTVIDALKVSVKKKYKFSIMKLNELVGQKKKIVLLTMHRRENWGAPMQGACDAVKRLAMAYPELNFVFPVHLNPIVRDVVFPTLGKIENVHLIEPLDYMDFVNLMAKSYLIITDSGGVQEEGPHFGIPILVLRKVTERPEAVKYGTVRLVGLDENKIYSTAKKLIDDKTYYNKIASAVNPYGDGLSAKRTVQIIKNYFGLSKAAVNEFIPKAGNKKSGNKK
ncbi:MAG: UDP-N-acetylglucosamine 2-epimerase (non-hydrolyzing) [Ignavibacteria bacterium]|nr:UDP-N-acetylglucosamine 2-epimerase (non-hydrolyzing) [Ignavibacteria bacterium]MCU7512119.1 UDP-N-acetylglucosamine 2-epimerase (non-hydrolyzing) [Ignavibacteria bacterium]MCU7523895.1 UDP-N-acetylglucosamine 2-epimerase (non-hydrolyzing) [Ignavibacteria bacterium]